VGFAVPGNIVTNDVIGARLGVEGDWIASRTGVRERRIAVEETLTDIATEAAAEALSSSGIEPAAVDLVLVATLTADDLLPPAAPLVAGRLGAHGAGAVDLNAACTGFLSALQYAAGAIETGRVRTVVVIGADLLSRVTDEDDRSTAGLLADGAGAVVVTAGGAGVIGPILLRSDSSDAELVVASGTEPKIRMAGQLTYKVAVAKLTEVTRELTEQAGLTLGDIDLFVYHQANQRILAAVGNRLGLDESRVVSCIEHYGNTSSSSIPIALATAVAAGRVGPGTRVLMGAFGAGFTWGAGLVEWR
jgi:3-oxoacyl-[acyl-carrier-protein] synthase-3